MLIIPKVTSYNYFVFLPAIFFTYIIQENRFFRIIIPYFFINSTRKKHKNLDKSAIICIFAEKNLGDIFIIMQIKIQLPKGFLDAEMRCSYEVTAEMKKVWAVELDLLCEFQRVAQKYGIKYIANGGTMLGAVRHRGFIPWDDDIDLMMMRNEYEKLCKIAPKEFNYPYFFQTEDTDPGSLRCHAQLRNSETTAILNNEKDCHFSFNQGVFIDIFPLDAVPDNESTFESISRTAMKYYNYMHHFASISWQYKKNNQNGKNVTRAFLHAIGNPLFSYLTHYYYKKYEAICKKYNGIKTQKLSIYCWGYKYKKLHRCRVDHEETIMLPFEFVKIPVCKNYDHALTEIFGDWHKFIIGGSLHENILFDTERPYTEYL